MRDCEVYIYSGFLDSGKSTFINDILAHDRGGFGGILLLLCEEGEVEPALCAQGGFAVERVGTEAQLTGELLRELDARHSPDTALIEYNGMWLLGALLRALPERWRIRRRLLFADARSFAIYNANMRPLVYDKLAACETVLFNRCDGADTMALHRLVRGVSGAVEIIYEYPGQYRLLDELEDELPYDLNSALVDISDEAYANWYRGMLEAPSLYGGRVFRFTCRRSERDGDKLGRMVMTCCADDISFAGLICRDSPALPDSLWIRVEARLSFIPGIGGVQPVAELISAAPCAPPVPEVASIL